MNEESTDIVAVPNPHALMPVMDIRLAKERYQALVEFVKGIMVEDKDFGPPFDSSDKNVLLKPGAEKLLSFFGLTPVLVDERVLEDDSDPLHPYYFYRRKCQLYRGDRLVGEGSGSCNSRESKYRWREAKRKCPNCGMETIRSSKAEFGGGWYCWAKIGGCGAKFAHETPAILNQTVGLVENPDIADIANTVLKMADKRAIIAATLIACNASEFFTQDIEADQVVEGTVKETNPKAQTIPQRSTTGTASILSQTDTTLTTQSGARQKNQWPDAQDIIKTLVRDGFIDAAEHAVGILNHSVFMNIPQGNLELYDIAVYLCGYQTWPQTWTTEDKATATNNQYLAGAPKEWEDAAKHILGMRL